MYQITLCFKEVIYKKNKHLINIHQKISNCTNFSKFSWGSMPPTPPPQQRVWLHYHVTMCRVLL